MSYRYFYHIEIQHGNGDPSEFLQQLRNEPLTNRFYRDVLRWSLATDMEYPNVGLVRALVYVVRGEFDEMPHLGEGQSWNPNTRSWDPLPADLWLDDMHLVASFTWYPTFEEDGARHIIKEVERWPYVWSDPFQPCGHRVYQYSEGNVLPEL